MKFFVNFLSAFRIASSFAIIFTMMFGMYWTTFVLFLLAAISDWFDGFLARKYNVCTKLGGVMDHIGDKLLVVNTFILLAAAMMPVWFIVVPIIIMIARELYISGLREFLGTQKVEMPVPKARFSMGKIKTTLQMIAIVVFLLLFAIAATIPQTDSRTMVWLINALPYVGILCTWLALVASVWSATQYTFTFAEKLKQIK